MSQLCGGEGEGSLPRLSSQWHSDPGLGRSPGKHPSLTCPARPPADSERPSVVQGMQSPGQVGAVDGWRGQASEGPG